MYINSLSVVCAGQLRVIPTTLMLTAGYTYHLSGQLRVIPTTCAGYTYHFFCQLRVIPTTLMLTAGYTYHRFYQVRVIPTTNCGLYLPPFWPSAGYTYHPDAIYIHTLRFPYYIYSPDAKCGLYLPLWQGCYHNINVL